MSYVKSMSFWKNVIDELDYRGISRKEFAFSLGINKMTFQKSIERDNIPSADLALRISKALGVSLEYLLDMEEKKEDEINSVEATNFYKKYSSMIKELETLSQREVLAVTQLINTLSS